jgi:anti-sigma-K factor RskA
VTCAHCDDAGAYVLGALSPDEHERFVAHLGGCEACRAEVDSLQIVVDTLPLAAEQVGPPPELKERIMAVVQAEAAVLRAAGPEADVADAAAPGRPAAPEPVEERARPRRTGSGRKATRPRWRAPLRPLPLAAAASVLVALIVAGAVLLSGGGDQGRTVQARVVAPSAPGAHAALVVGSGRATLQVEDFPPPPRGRVYQVWLKRPGRPPDPTTALFTVRGGGATVDVPGGVRDGEQVLVTAEPDGGSSAPTSPPVIVAEPA